MRELDKMYMLRALELAAKGRGNVSPNPMVGCVIVAESGEVIGEGYHMVYGEGHAEVNALASVENSRKNEIVGSTVYVTLEPCSHYGKTPPCADRLVSERVGRVVVGCTDPNPKVAGRGIQKLRDAGVEVIVGVEESKCMEINERFFTAQNLKRPYVILKWAETSDGFIDANRPEGVPAAWFTGIEAKKLVHSWRAVEDAVLVGRKTAEKDNPSLTVRECKGRNPKRVVLGGKAALSKELNLFNNEADTILYSSNSLACTSNDTNVNCGENQSLTSSDTSSEFGSRVIVVNSTDASLEVILKDMLSRGIQSVIVEGGAVVLHQFLSAGLWDEMRIFKTSEPLSYFYKELSEEQISSGVKAPKMEAYPHLIEQVQSRVSSQVGGSELCQLKRRLSLVEPEKL